MKTLLEVIKLNKSNIDKVQIHNSNYVDNIEEYFLDEENEFDKSEVTWLKKFNKITPFTVKSPRRQSVTIEFVDYDINEERYLLKTDFYKGNSCIYAKPLFTDLFDHIQRKRTMVIPVAKTGIVKNNSTKDDFMYNKLVITSEIPCDWMDDF